MGTGMYLNNLLKPSVAFLDQYGNLLLFLMSGAVTIPIYQVY